MLDPHTKRRRFHAEANPTSPRKRAVGARKCCNARKHRGVGVTRGRFWDKKNRPPPGPNDGPEPPPGPNFGPPPGPKVRPAQMTGRAAGLAQKNRPACWWLQPCRSRAPGREVPAMGSIFQAPLQELLFGSPPNHVYRQQDRRPGASCPRCAVLGARFQYRCQSEP